MSALAQLGILFLDTGNWSLLWLVTSLLHFIFKTATRCRLSVRAVLVSLDSHLILDVHQANALLESLFKPNRCEWSCLEVEIEDNGRQGISQFTIAVKLRHDRCFSDDPARMIVLRELSQKLAGQHRLDGHRVLVYPEWKITTMTPVDRAFGSYLSLSQLREMYDLCTMRSRIDTAIKRKEAAGRMLTLMEIFFERFGDLVSCLSDSEIEELITMPNRPALTIVIRILTRLFRAQRENNSKGLQECLDEAAKLDTEVIVELVVVAMSELAKHGRHMAQTARSLDATDSTCEEMAHVLNSLRTVMANNIALVGSVGMLARNVERSIKTRSMWTGGLGATGIAGFWFPPFFAFWALAGFTGYGWWRKSEEDEMVKRIQRAGGNIGTHSASCRLYILTIMCQAGQFYDQGTEEYSKYRELLRKNFDVDPEAEDMQINDRIKRLGLLIAKVIEETSIEVGVLGKSYDISM